MVRTQSDNIQKPQIFEISNQLRFCIIDKSQCIVEIFAENACQTVYTTVNKKVRDLFV